MARKRIKPQPHAVLAAHAITEMALDAQTNEDSTYDNELLRIIERHRAAGLPVGETGWSAGAKYIAPHGYEEHCPLCCDLDSCEERLEQARYDLGETPEERYARP